MFRYARFLGFVFATSLVCLGASSFGQAVKGGPAEGAAPPPITFQNLLPGVHTHGQVREMLGEPADESKWYNYKLYYPVKGKKGYFDVVHVGGKNPDSRVASVEAVSIPGGYETDLKILAQLGEPEYTLKMASWTLLDYSEQGLRFSVDADGKTIGTTYFPQGHRRVPVGERSLVDLSDKRNGPQPKPRTAPSLNGLKVGASEVIFSPEGEDWLGHKYSVHDDLKARIAVFDDGEHSVALVGADLFGMGWGNCSIIREEAKKLGIDETIIGMSHNHAAGDTIGVYGHYPTEYIAHLQNRIVAGIKEAQGKLETIKELRTASQELPMVGGRVHGLIRNARNPNIIDPTLSILQPIGQNGKPLATLVHFAVHVESLEKGGREISADFPGYMCEQIIKDGGGQAIFLNGAVGGMVSGDNRARTYESSEKMGLELAKIVKKISKTTQPVEVDGIHIDQRPLEIPMTNPDFTELYQSGLRTLHKGRVQTDMVYVKIGDIQLVTLPGELLPEVSYEILEEMDGFPRMLIGLANDQMGYMIPPYDFREGVYEESMSQGPSTAVQVRDMAIHMLKGRK